MPHVSVKRLGAGDGQNYRAERKKAKSRVVSHESPAPKGTQGFEHFGPPNDVHDAQNGEHQQIDQHNRTKKFADRIGASRLNEKKADEDAD